MRLAVVEVAMMPEFVERRADIHSTTRLNIVGRTVNDNRRR
jgi:hypothetical protein